jgi:hypothetical protein
MLPELSGARSVAPQAKTFGAMSFLQLAHTRLFQPTNDRWPQKSTKGTN